MAERLTRTESNLLMATWFVAGAVLIALNRQGGPQAAAMILSCVLFGAATSAGAALLFTLRLRRRILAAATVNTIGRDTAPGVRARLLLMWLVSSALPTVGIAAVVSMRSHGWIIEKTASVEIPVVVLSLVSVVVGLRGMMVVALSVSDPVRDVVEAMAKVEHGDIDVAVDVYERSEIGRLQNGFNRMVAGLAERDRLRDLFGRRSGGIHPVGAEPITGGGGRGA